MAKLPPNFVTNANDRYKQAKEFLTNWKSEARSEYAFISGNQWSDEDASYLREQKRPIVTFNYAEKMIDAVVGAEVSNRQEASYKPRNVEDAPSAEIRNAAAKWVRDLCDAEDEETDSFRDALICGIGCTHTRMSYDDDLDGNIEVHRCDPLEMLYDPASRKPGLVDRRYNFRTLWVDKKDAKREWPSAFLYPTEEESTGNAGVITYGHRYEDDEGDPSRTMHQDQVQIRYYECFEREPVYRIETPNGLQELSKEQFSLAKKAFDEAGTQYTKQFRKVYYRAFFADETLLEGGLSPCQKGFTFNFITGKRDRNRNTWYGLTRVMLDPQRWANKWLSQILHIVNSNAKGGIMAEIGAFVDPRKAQDEWAMPESITMLNEGGINKIKEKMMAQYPSGLDKMMQFALNSLPMVTGINLEALGLANREQAGVLEQQRKQAAYGLLAPLFDALRRYRKVQGRVLMSFINDFIADGRLVRIGGQENAQFVPLLKQKDGMEYDIFVDDSPTSPDSKEKTWTTLTSILPAMMKAGLPIPPDLLDYTPLPVNLATKWKQYIAQQAQQHQGPSPEQVKQLQDQMQKTAQENQQLKQQLQDKQVQTQQDQQKLMAHIELEKAKVSAHIQLEQAKVQAELQLAQEKQNADLQIAQDTAQGKQIIAQTDGNAKVQIAHYKANVDAINKLIASISNLQNESE